MAVTTPWVVGCDNLTKLYTITTPWVWSVRNQNSLYRRGKARIVNFFISQNIWKKAKGKVLNQNKCCHFVTKILYTDGENPRCGDGIYFCNFVAERSPTVCLRPLYFIADKIVAARSPTVWSIFHC